VEINPTRVCELLVGLPDVNVLGVDDDVDGPLRVHVESRSGQQWCRECGVRARVKDRPEVTLTDLTCFGRRVRLVWHKHRWVCPETACPAGSWTVIDDRIAVSRAGLTDRAGRWATRQVGKAGRSVSDVAGELGCDWHTVNDAVVLYGEALLAADTDRTVGVTALGLDETLFKREGKWRTLRWATTVADVGGKGRPSRLVEMVEGRTAVEVSAWIDHQPDQWRNEIVWGTLDLSGPYRKVFNDSLGHVRQVADRFHVVKQANKALDECRRRVQNETCGHRGRKDDPLFRARRLLTKAHARLDEKGEAKLVGLLEAGDPRGEVRMTWHAKEATTDLYNISDPTLARDYLTALIDDMADETMPVEVQGLAGTLSRWFDHIVAWHEAQVSNRPTESINNLIKRIKRVGFGFTKFRHYRVRTLLYPGRPNWDLLATVIPCRD
jgi:transposase